MRRLLMSIAAAGGLLVASLPATAQVGRIDPSLTETTLPITTVQFRGGGHRGGAHHIRPGGGGHHGGFGRPGRPGGGFHGGRPGRPGGWHGRPGYGGWHGGYRHRHRGYGVGAGVAGLAAGAIIGGAIASQAAPYYGAQPVYAAPPVGGDASAYCAQRFKSYDPGSGTYLGYDGRRHPCP